MLGEVFGDELVRGIVQAIFATLLTLLVVLVARRQRIHLERETLVALLRGFVQVVAVGGALVLLFEGPSWSAALVLLGMMFAAAATASRRAGEIVGAFRVSLYGIVVGSGAVIGLMTLLGVIESRLESTIPVGSMIIASAMNSSALALERFRSDVASNAGFIEAGLALGAAPTTVVRRYVRAAVQAAMIPRIDTLRSLGIVWIPGLMAGMILAGSDPVYAAIYQFVVIAMIYAAAGLTSLLSAMQIHGRVFTPAEQLAVLSDGADG